MTDGEEASFRLAAACCRAPDDSRRDEVLRATANDVADWPAFLALLKRHRIEPLAQAVLSAADVLPDDVASSLRERTQAIAQRSLAMAAETARLQALLDEAGVAVLVLKGAALAQLGYGSIAVKSSQDIDLLIAPEGRDAAIGVLQHDGYQLQRPLPAPDARQRELIVAYGREVSMQKPGGFQVELRWQVANSPSLLNGVDAHAPHQNVVLGGTNSLRTLNDDDLFAYLCIHGAGHGWARLQWLADLNAFIARRDVIALYRHAQALGAGPCALLALVMCGRVFGRPLPGAIAADIDMRTRLAVAMSYDLLTGHAVKERRFGTTRVALLQFLIGRGWRHQADTLRDMCFRLDDMLAMPLPPHLHFLYPLMRLPLWLWRKVR